MPKKQKAGPWLFNDKEITGDSQFIHIEAPYRAINGGNVPIKIYTDSPGIVKFTLIIDENPTPCCAIFEFDNIPAYVETNYGYRGKGATGMGVRLLYNFIKNF